MREQQKSQSRDNNVYPGYMPVILCLLMLMGTFSGDVLAKSERSVVKLAVKPLDLSRPPTTQELMAAGQLGGQLYPTEDIDQTPVRALPQERGRVAATKERQAVMSKQRRALMNLDFGKAIHAWNRHEYKKAVNLFSHYRKAYPNSPWLSEVVLHLGCEARYNGRYREAETHFRWIIEKNTNRDSFGSKMLLNKARSRLAVLNVLRNNIQEASTLFHILKAESPDWRDRTYAADWIQRLSRTRANNLALLNCGTQALAFILEQNGSPEAARHILDILPNSFPGQTLLELRNLAASYGYDVSGVQLSPYELPTLPLPAIVQISGQHPSDSGHYWVLEAVTEDHLRLFDPQSGRRFRQTLDEFEREWDGYALVFAEDSLPEGENVPGGILADNELQQIYGGCCGVRRPAGGLGDPERNSGPTSDRTTSACGSPIWSINMVNMNLYIQDIPLWYNPPLGPSISIVLSYNSQSASAYHEPFGNKWQFNYGSYLVVDPGGTVTIFMPDGRRDVYSPDGFGGYAAPYHVYNELTQIAENHFELRSPDDTMYVYNIPTGTTSQQPFLVEIHDVHGQSMTLSYNADVQLSTISDALGRVTTLTYNADGLVTQVSDPFARSASFDYDANRNLIRISDMGGYWTELSYDDDVYPTSLENARGRWEFYIEPADGDNSGGTNPYPAPGSPMWENYRITVTNPLGDREEYYYNGFSGYSWYVSPRDYGQAAWDEIPKTLYAFTLNSSGDRGEIYQIVYPETESWLTEWGDGFSPYDVQYAYDDDGNRTEVINVEGERTGYEYNTKGRVTSITDPKGNTTTLTYAANGVDPEEISDGLGTIMLTHNDTHQVTAMTDRLGKTTTFSYNAYGQLATQTDALGIVTHYVYDAGHTLTQMLRSGQVIASFMYDAIGRVKATTDATGLTQTYTYNNLNHVTSIAYADGKSTSYTYSGCCPRLVDSVSDRTGQTTHFAYDALKRLIESLSPEGGHTTYAYDANGNLTGFTDPEQHTTSFEYDLNNRPVKKTYHDGSYVEWQYNDVDLVEQYTNARGTAIGYSYDANGNLTGISYSDGTPGVGYSYDAYDRLTQMTDGTGSRSFDYDANSRLISVDGPWENDTLTYGYDDLGRQTELIPQSGTSLTYLYDTLNRLVGIELGAPENAYTYMYSGAGPLVQSLTRPNGSVTTYQYDPLNRVLQISNNTGSGELITHSYTYNAQDMRGSESITNTLTMPVLSEQESTATYNTVNQLVSATAPDRTYTYDPDGNLTQGSITPLLGGVGGGFPFTATYDAENRLTAIEYTDSNDVIHRTEYAYSGDDFLAVVKKYENGTLVDHTRIVRDGLLAIQDRDGSNNIVREYTWGLNFGGGIGGLLNLRQSDQDYAYLYDGKGNVTTVLDSAQTVVAAYRYDPFGRLLTQTGSLTQPFGFSTKRIDPQTGLTYYGYRFYSPPTGRWLTRDPLGEAGGINLYAFVGNNPINWIDPFGLIIYGTGMGLTGGIGIWKFSLAGGASILKVRDDKGNTGIAICSGGGGTTGSGILLGIQYTDWYEADTICDIEDKIDFGSNPGGGVAFGIGIAGEIAPKYGDPPIRGGSLILGVGIGGYAGSTNLVSGCKLYLKRTKSGLSFYCPSEREKLKRDAEKWLIWWQSRK